MILLQITLLLLHSYYQRLDHLGKDFKTLPQVDEESGIE